MSKVVKKMIVKKKLKSKKYEGTMIYLRPDQNDYLLKRSIFEYNQGNKKSEIVREVIDMAMATDPILDEEVN